MGIFTDAGVGRGVLAFNDKSQKRRSELANLFAEFKKTNPYATAEDYNSFVEGQVGPEEMYLRGSMPAGDILSRMGEDNQRKKSRDEYMQNVEIAGKDLAIRNQMQEMSRSMLLTHDDDEIRASLASNLPGQTAEERERSSEMVRNLTGNLSQLRQLEIQKRFDQQLQTGMEMIRTSDGNITSEDIMGRMNTMFPDMKIPNLNEYQTGLKKRFDWEFGEKKRIAKRQQDADIYGVMKDIDSSPRVWQNLTPGSEEYDISMQWIERALDRINIAGGSNEEVAANRAKLREDMIKHAQATRQSELGKANKANRSTQATSETVAMQGRFEDQPTNMQALLMQMEVDPKSPEHGIALQAAQRWLMPQGLQSNLIQFIGAGEYSSPTSAVDEWYSSLPPNEKSQLIAPYEIQGRATQSAAKMFPPLQDAKSFVSGMDSSIEKDNLVGKNTVDHFAKLMKGSDQHYKVKEAIQGIERSMANMAMVNQKFREKLTSTMDNKREWLIGFDEVDDSIVTNNILGKYNAGFQERMAQMEELIRIGEEKLGNLPKTNEMNQVDSRVNNGTSTSSSQPLIPLPVGQPRNLGSTPELKARKEAIKKINAEFAATLIPEPKRPPGRLSGDQASVYKAKLDAVRKQNDELRKQALAKLGGTQ